MEKPLARRFYQIKMGYVITTFYLYRIKKSNSERCWWCNAVKQDIDHLVFECKKWVKQRKALYNDLARKKIKRPKMSENRPKNRLFNTPKAVKPILDFLETTDIGRRPKDNEEEDTANKRLNEWDLNRLEREDARKEEEEEEEEGEGEEKETEC
jgi:hypothetical protein